ncbi:DUF6935 domain-containing protein [Fusobacterium russii]|uniref:DUF6935 domain-containing protein n=1 Tax=Fusobacterium russii TaxID=854 RepID=UPI0003A97FCF|nr:hypothetical protein [Fusobacterium russii]
MKKFLKLVLFLMFPFNILFAAPASNTKKNETWEIQLKSLPKNLKELKSLEQAKLSSPQDTAACYIAAICRYPESQEDAMEMIEFLNGPTELTAYDKQFYKDRLREKEYLPKSYLKGSSPENNYSPTKPYTVIISSNPYSYEQENIVKLFVKSSGADSPRPITLRLKPSTGEWFLWDQALLAGIRVPASSDPWK